MENVGCVTHVSGEVVSFSVCIGYTRGDRAVCWRFKLPEMFLRALGLRISAEQAEERGCCTPDQSGSRPVFPSHLGQLFGNF